MRDNARYSRRRIGRLLPILLGLVGLTAAHASLRPIDGGGVIGKEAVLPFLIVNAGAAAGDTVRFDGRFLLEDPTVFFPQVFRPNGTDLLLFSDLESETDSTWTFSVVLLLGSDRPPGDTLIVLAGEALAGADTSTRVFFSGLRFNDQPLELVEVRITTIPVGPQLRYVRFGQLDPGRPNPAVPGQTVSWGFRIDQESDVVFRIYDVTGRMVVFDDLGHLQKGVYRHSITTSLATPSGFFIVHLSTEIGDDYEVMHVLH